ncbi:conserved Plasmodium protein, unknown function [Plasmodium vinckei petteri]|uniref:Uncharacterized protein n=1 Tax=Plasmodium vinckei petteri TaxID=138298 RepID=A0A6V7SMU3_PLAVN|nr:conserved Plasmodium protein, unknown function [Plasmodium vinckei petteri]
MSCLNVARPPMPINDRLNKPAGKPTDYDGFNFLQFYGETKEKTFRSSIRNIDHKNKNSIFDLPIPEQTDLAKANLPKMQRTSRRINPHSSYHINKIFQGDDTNTPNKKYGKKIHPDIRNLYIFTNQSNYESEKKSSKKISEYSLNSNPYKWGVDVFRYDLPPPKKLYRHVNNLSTCLVPYKSEDSYIQKHNKTHYITQLEKSLCPKENVFVPNSSKKLIPIQGSKLEMNCVPRDQEIKRMKQNLSYNRGNLNADLTPLVASTEKFCHINNENRNKICSVSFNYGRTISPYRSGKRIGYPNSRSENSIFLF